MSEAVLQRVNRAPRATLETGAPPSELSAAALQVLATVPAWWARRASEAGLDEVHHRLDQALVADPPLAANVLAAIPPRDDLLDADAYELGETYVQGLDASVRTARGRHYTPEALASELWAQTLDALGTEPTGLVLDPACGAGSLLVPVMRHLVDANADTQPEMLLAAMPSLLGGRDLDTAAVWLANVILAAELLPVWAEVPAERRRPLPALCVTADGLGSQDPPAEVVVMNPPYGRVRLDEAARARHSRAVYGHANIYALFMAAALDQVGPGGVVSALVPAGWLGGSYFQRLRALLAKDAPLQRVSFVADRSGVFATGVLQETVLATFKLGAKPAAIDCRAVTIVGAGSVGVAKIAKSRWPAVPDQPWPLPRSSADVALVKAAAAMPARLATYGWEVSTGPLVWNRLRDRLSARPRKDSVKVLWAADMEGGSIRQHRRRNQHRYLQLKTERERQTFVLDRAAVLVQRTTSPEQLRRLVAAVLDDETLAAWGGEVVVENHVNVLRCSDINSVLTPALLGRLLDSGPLDRLYRCVTGSVAVSAYELAALPLPGPDVLLQWADLDDEALQVAIARTYGLKS